MLAKSAVILISAVFFLLMGSLTLVRPEIVLSNLGVLEATASARNEIRGVYGGFGLALGALIAGTLWASSVRKGVLVTVGVALLGMAGGRIVSLLVDGSPGSRRMLFFAVEVVLGLALLVIGMGESRSPGDNERAD